MPREDGLHRFWPTTGETLMTGVHVEAMARLDAEIARLQARKIQIYASEWQRIEVQTARIPSAESKARELPLRSASAEYAASARVSDSSMQTTLERSGRVVRDFPTSLSALRDGQISHAHLLAIVEAGQPITDRDMRGRFEESALSRAATMTPGQLRNSLALLSDRMQNRTMAERHQVARGDRAVRVIDLADGMAELLVVMPSPLAHGIHDRLTQQAKLIKQHNARREAESKANAHGETASATHDRRDTETAARDRTGGVTAAADADARETWDAAVAPAADADADGDADAADDTPVDDTEVWDHRTVDHIRADLVADMLLTSVPGTAPVVAGDGPGGLGAIRAVVQVTVPALTLLGRDDGAADLAGSSPIDPESARCLAGNSPAWTRILTHPLTGMVCAVDRYHASAEMKRFLAARDQHCRFPGCRTPAHRCDLDHNLDFALGGKTHVGNLCHLCKRHHVLKTEMPWKAQQLAGGVIQWTSPTGRVYIDEPPTLVGFTPDFDGVYIDEPPTLVGFSPDFDPPPF